MSSYRQSNTQRPLLVLVGVALLIGLQPRSLVAQSAGAPLLVITSATNPFTSYYTEILRAEGLNLFSTATIASVTPASLAAHDVVILGEMPLSAAQVEMFTDWVTAGGNLIAMRPDKALYGLLGLTDAGGTIAEGYLLLHTQSSPAAGLVNQTIQFHGTADVATLSGATSLATLYSNAITATASPAVTLRPIGVSGGQAVAFLYDLAKSVVLTRQGNPAWAGQERDGLLPTRSDDMFFGNAALDPKPDWINLNKVAIPQADEQQRLLANTILHVNQDRRPLPRFWYFPRDEKAVVVMTGDAHGSDQSTARLNELMNASAPNCSVNDWECLRATTYIYPDTPSLFNGSPGVPGTVADYVSKGFEIALHPNTGCQNYTAQSLSQNFTEQLGQLALRFPSLPAPRTNRTHCIVWSDYTSQPEVERQHGIRLDTTYYYWPGFWVLDRPGFMTGSGMPMRFAKETGEIIDVYQAATQMQDEVDALNGQTYPKNIDQLLDRAIGPEGYYGAFVANMHGDGGGESDVKQAAIVASAQARGVPVVSAAQMLDWLDGRNNSAFGGVTWDWGALTLTFTVTRAAGANGLRGMVPNYAAGSLQQVTRNGQPIQVTLDTIKGITYAIFDATTGTYVATYEADTTPPAISAVTSTVLSATSASVGWDTNEAATTRIDYGTSPGTLTQNAINGTLLPNHSITLDTLTPFTTYYYRVTSVDFFGNSTTFPPAGNAPLTFATPPLLQSFLDTTTADFSAGTPGVDTIVAQTDDGEVILRPAAGSEFFGPDLPPNWVSAPWDASGSVTIANGQLLLNNGYANTTTTFSAGRSLEFVATFGGDAFLHSGFAVADFAQCGFPWAIFSTKNTPDQLFARTSTQGCNSSVDIDTPLPANLNLIGNPHRYRIDWSPTHVTYFVDGVQVAQHQMAITGTMQMLAASDFDDGGANPTLLAIDWERLSPYSATGSFLSRIFDATTSVPWYSLGIGGATPGNTTIVLQGRVGNTPLPDASWSAFMAVGPDGLLIGSGAARTGRYFQYRASLSTSEGAVTPELRTVSVNYAVGITNTAPEAGDDSRTTNEDAAVVFAASGASSLLANDADAETPEQLSVLAVSAPANGSANVNPDGSVTYTPNSNFHGIDAFSYTVTDGSLTDSGLVTITVNAVNDAPLALADPAGSGSYQVNEDGVLVVTATAATGLLANDSDVESDRSELTAVVDTPPAHGTLVLSADGSFTYTPFPNFSGPDGFFYRASDGSTQSERAGVSILVLATNDAPVANDDSYHVSQSSFPVRVSSLVRTGSIVQATTSIQHGFSVGHPVTISGANESEYNGTFTVTAAAATTFSYTIAGTPASPATGIIRALAQDQTRTFAAPGVIGNDIDLEGQALSAVLGTTAQHGTLQFNGDGSFTYTPNPSFVGVDTFSYAASDGFGGTSNTAIVTLNVHLELASQAVDDGGTVTTGEVANAGDPLETSVTTPLAGTINISEGPVSGTSTAPGYTFLGQEVNIGISSITDANPVTDPSTPIVIAFTLDATLLGDGQTFDTLQVFRNNVQLPTCPAPPLTVASYPCVSARQLLPDGDVRVTVLTLAPSDWGVAVLIAGDDNVSTPEDMTLNSTLAGLSGHPEPSALTFALEAGPANGVLTFNSDGSYVYTPAPNFSGSDGFTYSVSDGLGGVGEGSVVIVVTAVNDPPDAVADPATVTQGSSDNAIDVLANDTSAPDTGETLRISSATQGANGSVTVTADGTGVSYTPNAGFSGTDTFTYTISDGNGGSDSATVTVTVRPVPSLRVEDVSVTEGHSGFTPATFAINLSQADSLPVTVSFQTIPGAAKERKDFVATSGTLTFAPGETSKSVVVQVVGDNQKEKDEAFVLRVASPVNATIARAEGTGTIRDDDQKPSASIQGASKVEGSSTSGGTLNELSFRVELSNPSEIPVSVSYTTLGLSATAGADFEAQSGVLTFGEDDVVKYITIKIVADRQHEALERVRARLYGPVEMILVTPEADGDIEDDDPSPTLSVSDVSVLEGQSGTTAAVFTVSLSEAAGVAETVTYQTVAGTAAAPADFADVSGTLTFEPGDTSKTVTVLVSGDPAIEPSETFSLIVSKGSSDLTILKGNGIATIIDDDSTSWVSGTYADLTRGTVVGSLVSDEADGTVLLQPRVAAAFTDPVLPQGWTKSAVGTASYAGGTVTLNTAQIQNVGGLYPNGQSLEFVATFGGGAQFVGLTLLRFNMKADNKLYATTLAPKNQTLETLVPGNWVGTPRRFRITWMATTITYSVDGVVVATHTASFPNATAMMTFAQDLAGGGALVLDWVRVSPYGTSGTYTSEIYDVGSLVAWKTASLSGALPAGTGVQIEVRTGDSAGAVTGAAWTPVGAAGVINNVAGRYAQYRLVLTTSNTTVSPEVREVTLTFVRP